MSRELTVAILTGGGDVPGLNTCIKTVVNQAEDRGWKVLGIRRGWDGLLSYNPENEQQSRIENTEPLDRAVVRTIDRYGGTHLHTSRANPQKVRQPDLPRFLEPSYPFAEDQRAVDCTPHVLKVIEHLGIDVIVPIGGDDTLSFAARLDKEGVPVVAIPKTMDNDVFGTDYCIGFSTAITRSVDAVHALRVPTGSHERIAVVELFGRNSGETALITGYLAGVDRTVISEVPFDVERLADFLAQDRSKNPSRYSMLVISEGAKMVGKDVVESGPADPHDHRKLGGIGLHTSDEIKRLTRVDTVYEQLAYLMRSGPPDSLDRMVATSFGNLAVQQIDDRKSGIMLALRDGRYTVVPVGISTEGVKRVDIDKYYDPAEYKPQVSHLLNEPMFLR